MLFRSENVELSASLGPWMTGTLLGSNGSEPNVASITSGNPSPSLSAVELGLTTVKPLFGVRNELELPLALVATRANVPDAVVANVKFSVAEVPEGLMTVVPTVIAGGLNAGAKEKVEAVRLMPEACKTMALLERADLGLTEVMTGTGTT